MGLNGSRRYFGYEDDNGVQWAIQADESMAETAALGFAALLPATVSSGRRIVKGQPIKMRYILLSRLDADDRVITKKVPVGAITATAWGATSVTVDGAAWAVTYRHGERQQYIPLQDTGLIDGDVDENVAAGP